MRRSVLGVGAVVLVIAMAGCGGSGSLSRAQFTQRADAVCTRALRELSRTPAVASASSNTAETFAARYAAYHRAKAAGIGALKPPKELQSSYEQYIRTVTSAGALFQQALTAVRAKASTAAIAPRLGPLLHQEEQLAVTLGINACVEHLPHGRRF